MKTQPFVSIVIPSFNRAEVSLIALDSVLKQTYSDYEVIFVDDGSTDETSKCLSQFLMDRCIEDGKVRYIYQENQGQSVARNKGITEARGTWIAFLDSDDAWLPEKLEWQIRAIEKFGDQCGACFTDAKLLNNLGQDVTSFQTAGRHYEQTLGIDADETNSLARIFGGPWIQTLMARADLIRQMGGFDSELRFAEDHDFLFRLSLITSYCYVNLPLAMIDRAGAPADKSRLWEKFEFRLQSRQNMFEKWLKLKPSLRPDVRKAIVHNLRSTHSSWANWCLENGRYEEAREQISKAVKHQLTPGLAFKWILTHTAPSMAKKIVPKSKSYFELV